MKSISRIYIFIEIIFLLFKKICEIDSFYFTKFLAWTFYNLWHHCSVYLGGSIGGENFVPFAHVKFFFVKLSGYTMYCYVEIAQKMQKKIFLICHNMPRVTILQNHNTQNLVKYIESHHVI